MGYGRKRRVGEDIPPGYACPSVTGLQHPIAPRRAMQGSTRAVLRLRFHRCTRGVFMILVYMGRRDLESRPHGNWLLPPHSNFNPRLWPRSTVSCTEYTKCVNSHAETECRPEALPGCKPATGGKELRKPTHTLWRTRCCKYRPSSYREARPEPPGGSSVRCRGAQPREGSGLREEA